MSSAVVTVLETQLMSGSIEPDYINDMSERALRGVMVRELSGSAELIGEQITEEHTLREG